MVGWKSVLGKGGKVDRAEARTVGLRRAWNSSDDGEIVERNVSELLQCELNPTCSNAYWLAHFMTVPRNPDKVTMGISVRPVPSQSAIWSLMNSGVIESFER